MSKLKKLFFHPNEFLRDYFLKKAPLVSNKVSSKSEKAPLEELYPISFPIDIVYTWVDGSNETFLRQHAFYKGEKEDITTDMARFESHDELKYSIRSVLKYAPWVNHIYIVTNNGEIPKWLDVSFEKITVISHKEIIDEKYLPTFNSHVIEANLWKIPNLTEHYIYFNDDVLLTRPVSESLFFTSGGLAKLFITNAKLSNCAINSKDKPTEIAAKNARQLILQYTHNGTWVETLFAHTFHPQLKKVYQYIWQEFSVEIEQFLNNKFRSAGDIHCTFLHHHLALLLGKAVATRTHSFYFNIRDKNAIKNYRSLLSKKGTNVAPYSMCLNDTTSNTKSVPNYTQQLADFLELYFPDICTAEIDEIIDRETNNDE
ncbi:MAG: Stealth CR1 domain-containing protein [Neisseriaceae bacterium]|nr:Stealth CR1 domain-containing protein [Neisseriaceae bacterium]